MEISHTKAMYSAGSQQPTKLIVSTSFFFQELFSQPTPLSKATSSGDKSEFILL